MFHRVIYFFFFLPLLLNHISLLLLYILFQVDLSLSLLLLKPLNVLVYYDPLQVYELILFFHYLILLYIFFYSPNSVFSVFLLMFLILFPLIEDYFAMMVFWFEF